jgi:hypothetical protein
LQIFYFFLFFLSFSVPQAADESSSPKIEISSKTIYGAIRALETLSQIISYDFETAHYMVTKKL